MMKKLVLPLLLVGALAACTSPNSVGNLAIGDDSAAINAGRNRAEAQVSIGVVVGQSSLTVRPRNHTTAKIILMPPSTQP